VSDGVAASYRPLSRSVLIEQVRRRLAGAGAIRELRVVDGMSAQELDRLAEAER
jgi:hypothetical protein